MADEEITKEPQDGADKGQAPADGAAQDAKPKQYTQAEFDAILNDRRQKNKENQALKKERDEYAEKLKAIEDAKKDELQRATEKAAEVEARLAAREKELAHKDRINAALKMNAVDADVVALVLEREGLDLSDAEAVSAFKATKPYLFAQPQKTPPPASGAGGPPSGNGSEQQQKQAKVAELEAKIAACRDDTQKHFLRRELRRVLQER